tara:strand:- start:134 stop:652 length:519 start_codon:yes stop_codon:yes gene_type:complete
MTNTNSGYVALTNFITVTKADGTDPSGDNTSFTPYNKFQNGKHGVVLNKDDSSLRYNYLSFLYQGATRNRSGDNMTSSLILANSEISMRFAVEAVTNKYHVKVETWLMTDAFEQNKPLTEEQWLASSMSYDPEAIEIILSSAIDAVGANAPNKVLTHNLVGSLPVTGSLQNR